MTQNCSTDLLIVGAGPVGLFSVFEAGLLNIRCHLIDALDRPGGQCTELYPEKPIYDIPSRVKITGQELVDDLLEQAKPFDPVFHLGQQAQSVRRQDGRWHVTTTVGTSIDCAAIAIAGGHGSFLPKRPPVPGIEAYEGRSVFYSVRKMEDFRGKRILIAGGGDSALDWVINLAPIAERITLIHRRDDFRGAPESVAQMRELVAEGRIDLLLGEAAELFGIEGQLSSVGVKTKSGEVVVVPCHVFLPFFGLKTDLGPIATWGLNLEHNLITVNPSTCETDEAGIFALGDMCTYPGKIKLILCGFHEAAVMTRAAFRHVHPTQKLSVGYTTTSTHLQERLGVA